MNPNQALLETGRHELTIKVAAETTLPPHRVLEAAHDFSESACGRVAKREVKAPRGPRARRELRRGNRRDLGRRPLLGAEPLRVVATGIGEGNRHRLQHLSAWQHLGDPSHSSRRRKRGRAGPTPRLSPRAERQDRQRRPPHSRQMGLGLVPSERPRSCREADCLALAHSRQDASAKIAIANATVPAFTAHREPHAIRGGSYARSDLYHYQEPPSFDHAIWSAEQPKRRSKLGIRRHRASALGNQPCPSSHSPTLPSERRVGLLPRTTRAQLDPRHALAPLG